MAYDITKLTDKLTTIKSRTDDLNTSITYRESEIEDLGINNQNELGNQIHNELDSIIKTLEVTKAKLDSITYGKGPTAYGATGYGMLARAPWGP